MRYPTADLPVDPYVVGAWIGDGTSSSAEITCAESAIVEELFPIEAISDLHAFFGAADDDDLRDRMERMVASTTAFGANRNVDTVPTRRYVFRTPFVDNLGGRRSE